MRPGRRRQREWLKRGLRCPKLVCPPRWLAPDYPEVRLDRAGRGVPGKTVSERVVIAVDPHKASWTAAAVSSALAPLATLRTPVSRQGYRQPRRFAARWPDAEWVIEGATGLGAPLATWLSTDGIEAVDVPAKLATRVRMLSTGHGRKNDDADAVSVGVAALTAARLQTVAVDETVI